MKRTRTFAICSAIALGWVLANPMGALAQTNQTQPAQQPPGPRAPEARQPIQRPRMNIEARVQRLTERLTLTQEQQTKLRAILEEEQRKLQELQTNTATTPAERMTKVRQIRDETNNKIREMLTEEQRQKFDAIPRARIAAPAGSGAQTNQPVQPGRPRGPRAGRPNAPGVTR